MKKGALPERLCVVSCKTTENKIGESSLVTITTAAIAAAVSTATAVTTTTSEIIIRLFRSCFVNC